MSIQIIIKFGYMIENEEFRDYTLQESVKVEIFDDLIIDFNDMTE